MIKKHTLEMEIALGLLISVIITAIFAYIGYTPSGNDIWGHIFKTEFLAQQIKQGNFYPLYSSEWYNGIQLYRYWPIFTYYITGLITVITGDAVLSYYIFMGLTFFMGYIGWCLIANREDKKLFIIIGLLWWFLPDNLRVFFSEGNLARVLITSMLPLFLYFFTSLVKERKCFIQTVIMVFLMTNTHFMITAMCAIIFCLYGFFKGLKEKTWYLGFTAFICGFILSFITLFPGIAGGIISDGNSASAATMQDWSQDLFKSLFYLDRNKVSLAFGLFVLLAGIFVLVKGKGNKAGTIIAFIFFVLSDVMFIPILMQMPLSQVWWMARFCPMCYVLILYEFGLLKPKRGVGMVLLCAVFIIDCIPVYTSFIRRDDSDLSYALYDEAVSLTDSRLGILDESLFGSYPSYAAYKSGVPYLQGWAIQGATIKDNIVFSTESMKLGWYGYTFKNTLELGCDTVIVYKYLLPSGYDDDLIYWAGQYGYELIDENDEVYLFDNKDIHSGYGTNFQYDCLAVGSSSSYISYMYPQFEKGNDSIDDYKYEELVRYEKIYLSNFECSDFDRAQELLWSLSESGVEIYIDATYIPINYLDVRSMFGVESRFINTEGSFDLNYKDKHYNVELPYEWNATYLTTYDPDVELYSSDGIGLIAKRGNITMLGLNMLYINIENRQDGLKEFFDYVFHIESKAPVYEIVPVAYEYGKNSIDITAEKPCVTTIAWQDNFSGEITETNNLVEIKDKNVHIDIYYKYLKPGMVMVLIGCITTLTAYAILIRRKNEKEK